MGAIRIISQFEPTEACAALKRNFFDWSFALKAHDLLDRPGERMQTT